MPVLAVQDLSIAFRQNHEWRRVVDAVSLSIDPNQTLCLVGESGSGKSSIALAIARLLPTARVAGSVHIQGQSVYALQAAALRRLRRQSISFIFQNPEAGLLPNRTIGRQLLDVICFRTESDQRAGVQKAEELLDQVSLSRKEIWPLYPHQLSGGMCQRVLLVMALCIRPKLVIADEPTSSLDALNQARILSLLSTLQRSYQFAMLFITHDLAVAAYLADCIGVLKSGNLLELQSTRALFDQPQAEYSKQLIVTARTLAETVR